MQKHCQNTDLDHTQSAGPSHLCSGSPIFKPLCCLQSWLAPNELYIEIKKCRLRGGSKTHATIATFWLLDLLDTKVREKERIIYRRSLYKTNSKYPTASECFDHDHEHLLASLMKMTMISHPQSWLSWCLWCGSVLVAATHVSSIQGLGRS